MITFDHFHSFWSCCLVHSQQENFLNQCHQKLHYRPSATSIINTKVLHFFSNLIINFISGSNFKLESAHYSYLPNVSLFFLFKTAVLKAVNHPANYGGLQQLKLNYNF